MDLENRLKNMVYFNEKIEIYKKFDYLEEMMYNLNRGEMKMRRLFDGDRDPL